MRRLDSSKCTGQEKAGQLARKVAQLIRDQLNAMT